MSLVQGDADQVGLVMNLYQDRGRTDNICPRYNVAQLEQWARDQKIEDTGNKVIDTLLPIILATQLLQVPFTTSYTELVWACLMFHY